MDNDTSPTKAIWGRLGGQLGVGLCVVGFVLVFLGWNGAASRDRIPAQFPYLISGGIAGLCFVVVGVGMLVVQNQRADRAALQASLRELRDALVVAGMAQSDGEARKPFAKPGPRPRADAAVEPDAADVVDAAEPVEAEPAPAARKRASRSKPLAAPSGKSRSSS